MFNHFSFNKKFKTNFSKNSFKFFNIFLALFIILVVYFGLIYIKNNTKKVPANSGEFIEGLVGQPITLNPLFSQNEIDVDISSLIFSSLFNYKQGKIESDVAESYVFSQDFKTLEIKIKDNIFWHDNEKLGVDDVVFTYTKISENPETASFWRGIEVSKKDENTIVFNLSSPNPNLIENLTEKILPFHVLGNLSLEEIRDSDFGENPLGSGPYYFYKANLSKEGAIGSIELRVFTNWNGKKPFLRKIFFRFYPNKLELYNAFKKREVMAVGGLSPSQAEEVKSIFGANINPIELPSYQGVFINLQNPILNQKEIRAALNLGVNEKELIDNLLLSYGKNVNIPWPASKVEQTESNYNPDLAKQTLEKAGFVDTNNDGFREKGDQKLKFVLSTNDDILNKAIAEKLKEQWKSIGIEIEVKSVEEVAISFEAIGSKQFDLLLFGENLGHNLDLFAYFHSSQIGKGLNFFSYSNKKVDQLLAEGRATGDKSISEAKNLEAAKIIGEELPAIFLFSQNYLYVVDSKVKGTVFANVYVPSERFSNVNEWYLNEKRVLK